MEINNDNIKKEPQGGFVDSLCTVLSWVLVPLMMPVYGIMLIFHLSLLHQAPQPTKILFTLIIFGINMVLPAILIYLLKLFGLVKDVGLNERKERFIPYIITLLCMGSSAFFMYVKGAPMWVAMFFAGGAAGALVNFIVNNWWKISAHAAGIAGIVALLIRINIDGVPTQSLLPWICGAVFLSGLLGSARIWMGRHTVWQIICGYIVGFCGVYFLTMI